MRDLVLLKEIKPIGKSLWLLRAVQNEKELFYLYDQLEVNKCKKIVLYKEFHYKTNNSAFTLLFLRHCMESKVFIENGKEKIPELWIAFKRPNSYFLKNKDINNNYLSIFIDGRSELKYIDIDIDYIYKNEVPSEEIGFLENYAELGVYLEYDNMWLRWFRRVQKGDQEIWIQ